MSPILALPAVRYQSLQVILLLLCLSAVTARADGPPTWERVAQANGIDQWPSVSRIEFEWAHAFKSPPRHYVWDLRKRMVTVTNGDSTVTIPTSGRGLESEAERTAHRTFINDSYWLLFEFRAVWDDAQRKELGVVATPFGQLNGHRVAYPAVGGYTPGDHYELYVDGDRVVGWAYFKGGSSEPTLQTTREGWQQFGPLRLPTKFVRPDGTTLIEMHKIVVDGSWKGK